MKLSTNKKLTFAVKNMVGFGGSNTSDFEAYREWKEIQESETEFSEWALGIFYKMLKGIKSEVDRGTEEYSVLNNAVSILDDVRHETGNEFNASIIDENGERHFKETRAEHIRGILGMVGSNIEGSIELGILGGQADG